MASSKIIISFFLLFCAIYCVNAGIVKSKVSAVKENFSPLAVTKNSLQTLKDIVLLPFAFMMMVLHLWPMMLYGVVVSGAYNSFWLAVNTYRPIKNLRHRKLLTAKRKNSDLPYTAWIRRLGDEYNMQINCGGAIISNRHILTTRSCIGNVRDKGIKKFTAILGPSPESATSGNVYEVPIEHVISHPNFDNLTLNDHQYMFYDLAILRTRDEIKFSDSVKKIDLPETDATTGLFGMFSSWNMTEMNNWVYNGPEVLQYLDHDIPHNSLFERIWKDLRGEKRLFFTWRPNILDGIEFSNGDIKNSKETSNPLKGSPLFKDGALVGIASNPNLIFECNVNIYEHKDWIQSEVRNDFESIQ